MWRESCGCVVVMQALAFATVWVSVGVAPFVPSKRIVGVAACCGVLQSMVQRVFSLELAAQSPNMTSFSTAESLQLLQQDMDEYRSINDDLMIQHPPARDDPHVRASSS